MCQESVPGQTSKRDDLLRSRGLGRRFQVDLSELFPLLQVVGKKRGNLAELYIQGVPACGGRGSTEVARFLAQQLRLPNPLHRWQKRKVAYLLK